jgi:phage terminase large subunit GpA-like protein
MQDDHLDAPAFFGLVAFLRTPADDLDLDPVVLDVDAGDPAKPEVWNDLDEITLREWTTEGGRRLRLGAVGIDTGGHHADAVYKFCTPRRGRRVYAIKGMAGIRPMWPPKSGGSKKYKGHKVWIVGVDTAKDAIYSRLRIADSGPGYCFFGRV